MVTYEELQRKGVEAFRNYYDEQRRASEIIDSIGKMCIDVLGFPAANVAFRATEDIEDKKLRPRVGYVIDRDSLGKWKACISLKWMRKRSPTAKLFWDNPAAGSYKPIFFSRFFFAMTSPN